MKEIIEVSKNLSLERETLSDGSKVFNVLIKPATIECESEKDAFGIFTALAKIINQ